MSEIFLCIRLLILVLKKMETNKINLINILICLNTSVSENGYYEEYS